MNVHEERIGRVLSELRGAMSQKDLSVAMRDRGPKWSQATVWNVERGERPLRMSEAIHLAEILHTSVGTFAGETSASVDLWDERRDALRALEQIDTIVSATLVRVSLA